MRTILSKGDTISDAGARKFLTEICNVPAANFNQQLQDYYPIDTNIDVLAFKKKDDPNNNFDPVTGILTLDFGPNGFNPNHISKHTNKIHHKERKEAKLWGMVFYSDVSKVKTYEFMGVFEPLQEDKIKNQYRFRLVGNDVIEY